MVQSCSAFGCKTRYKKNTNIKFHKYPKDREMQKKWIAAVNDPYFEPSAYSVLCSHHFQEKDYISNVWGTKILISTAVPKKINPCSQETALKRLQEKDRGEWKFSLDHSYSLASKTTGTKKAEHLLNGNLSKDLSHKHQDSHKFSVLIKAIKTSEEQTKVNLSVKNTETFTKKRKLFRYMGDFVAEDLETPGRREMFWSTFQKYKKEKDKEIQHVKRKNRRLQTKVKTLETMIEKLQSGNKMSTDCNVTFKKI